MIWRELVDFGIARADFDREGETRSVQFGTARYMAPEQWLNEEVTPAVDIFALGITLIELLKGEWAGRLPLRPDKYNAGRDEHIQSIRDPIWGAVWWRRLEELLQDMLSQDPLSRPSAAPWNGVISTYLPMAERSPDALTNAFGR